MIFIPFNVPSLKNSKKPVTLPGKDYTTFVPSDAVRKYLQKIGVKKYSGKKVECYTTRPNLFRQAVGDYFKDIQYPARIKFYFVRDTKRKFDFHNAVQIIADLLVAHGFIEDDNMDCFVPFPMFSNGKWYSVDKNRPGVYLKIEEG
jgi:hypothetical protein